MVTLHYIKMMQNLPLELHLSPIVGRNYGIDALCPQDAAKTLQHALELGADPAAAHNLLVCCYALGDVPAMQDQFRNLLQVSHSNGIGHAHAS